MKIEELHAFELRSFSSVLPTPRRRRPVSSGSASIFPPLAAVAFDRTKISSVRNRAAKCPMTAIDSRTFCNRITRDSCEELTR